MRRATFIAATLLALLAAVGLWLFWPRTTTEVSERAAMENFRERTEGSSTTQPDRLLESGAVPHNGVYTYASTGTEEVKFGPLPTETRPLPETVTAIVVDPGNDCFTLTLNLFEEHTEDTTYCTSDGGLRLTAHIKHQRIGALSPTATMSCDPDILVHVTTARVESLTTELHCELKLSGGPANITASLVGTASTGDTETVAVGNHTVDALPLTVEFSVTGDLTGSWTESSWFSTENWLPVRIERHMKLSGPAAFSEDSELVLTDLAPLV